MKYEIEKYKNLENQIERILTKIKKEEITVLNSSKPRNLLDQKNKFLKNPTSPPEFEYRPISKNILNNALAELQKLSLPRGALTELYKDYVSYKILQLKFIKARGNYRKRRKLSKDIWGKPNREVSKFADEIIKAKETRPENPAKDKNQDDLVKALKQRLDELNITDWDIVSANKYSISIMPKQKKILIPKHRKFSQTEIERLVVHEINVHVRRGHNSHNQPLMIFREFPHYMETEEGLALYFEEEAGFSNNSLVKKYAARVIAVNLVYEELHFIQVYNHLIECNIDSEQAWQITYRVFRGGGLLKDHIYLQGYLKVKKYLEENPRDMKYLLAGKVGIEYIPLLKGLDFIP
jgi:uncharacterized protein (TIGR02421 family)